MTEGIITTKGAAFASHTHKKIQFVSVHSISAVIRRFLLLTGILVYAKIKITRGKR